MADLQFEDLDRYIKGIEAQHKQLNLLMGYWTVFASQKKEYDLQTRLMDEIKAQTESRLQYAESFRKPTIEPFTHGQNADLNLEAK